MEGRNTDKHLDFFLDMLDQLEKHKIAPLVVLDGACLAAKEGCDAQRRESRNRNRVLAEEACEAGDAAASESFFKRAVTITPQMVSSLLKELRRRKVDFLVAPYEADAQLAFLSLQGVVDLVISEDSDTIVYGCRRVVGPRLRFSSPNLTTAI